MHLFFFFLGEDPEEAVPDDIGHLVGWVPIDPSLRTHLWHLSVVDLKRGEGLFLKNNKLKGKLQISIEKLENFIGKTFELIGTNVNANPYGKSFDIIRCIYGLFSLVEIDKI